MRFVKEIINSFVYFFDCKNYFVFGIVEINVYVYFVVERYRLVLIV